MSSCVITSRSTRFSLNALSINGFNSFACLKRRDLFEEISDYMSESYDFLIDVFDPFTLSILSDLLPEDISKVKARLTNGSLRKVHQDLLEQHNQLTSHRTLRNISLDLNIRDTQSGYKIIKTKPFKKAMSEVSGTNTFFDCPYLRNFIISTFDSGRANDVPREIFRNVL